MLLVMVGIYGAYKFISIIFLLFLGSVANSATSGAIAVPVGINTSITGVVTSISTGFTAFGTGDTFILSLIALVTLLRVFWPVIAQYMPGGKKKSTGGNTGGFMN